MTMKRTLNQFIYEIYIEFNRHVKMLAILAAVLPSGANQQIDSKSPQSTEQAPIPTLQSANNTHQQKLSENKMMFKTRFNARAQRPTL